MTRRGDRPEPLWASSLADQPRPAHEDVIVRVLEEEPDETPAAPPREEPSAPGRGTAIAAALGALAVVVLSLALDRSDALTVAEVPSGWGRVPMTCDTVRMEKDGGAVEWFSCRAVGGLPLPPGLYRSPESRWTSDITRRPARENRIRISPDGEVEGWAKY